MNSFITLMSDKFSCDFCDAASKTVARLHVETWPQVSEVYICLACLLKAVGLLEVDLDQTEKGGWK